MGQALRKKGFINSNLRGLFVASSHDYTTALIPLYVVQTDKQEFGGSKNDYDFHSERVADYI